MTIIKINDPSNNHQWNYRLDLLSFIINIIIVIIPALYWLLSNGYRKLSGLKFTKNFQMKMTNNSNNSNTTNDLHIHYYNNSDYYETINSDSEIQIQIDGPSTPTTTTLNQPLNSNEFDYPQQQQLFKPDQEPFIGMIKNENDDTDTTKMTKKDCQRILFWEEIVTQLSYLLLIIIYLGQLIELLILDIAIVRIDDDDEEKSMIFIDNLQLINIILTIIIHLLFYGLIYGKYFLFNSVIDRLLQILQWIDSKHHHRQLKQVVVQLNHELDFIILHAIAFGYFFLNLFINISKIVILILFIASDQDDVQLFELIRPYFLITIIILQFYFTSKHLLELVIFAIRICYKRDLFSMKMNKLPTRSNKSTTTTNDSFIRYRRNHTTFLSKLTFSWFIPILKIGYRKNLCIADLGTLTYEERCTTQTERFLRNFHKIDVSIQ